MFFKETAFLHTETARLLFQEVAELPLLAPCGHFSARELTETGHFSSIAEVWLANGAVRTALRTLGVEEEYITGDTSDFEKFEALSAAMPRLTGHPVFDVCHAELRLVLGYDLPINPTTCAEIWQKTAAALALPGCSKRALLDAADVSLLFTSDDPAYPLPKTLPSGTSPGFCPERLLMLTEKDTPYIKTLGDTAGVTVKSLDTLGEALSFVLDRFTAAGCRTALHLLPRDAAFCRPDPYHANEALCALLRGERINEEARALLHTQLWRMLSAEYTRRDMVLLCSIPQYFPEKGVRNRRAAPEAILLSLLQYLYAEGLLPRVLLCPRDALQFSALAPLCGALAARKDDEPSVSICASAKLLTEATVRELARMLPLGALLLCTAPDALPGVWDEYARRALCDALGAFAAQSDTPPDKDALTTLAQDICYGNAARLFGLA